MFNRPQGDVNFHGDAVAGAMPMFYNPNIFVEQVPDNQQQVWQNQNNSNGIIQVAVNGDNGDTYQDYGAAAGECNKSFCKLSSLANKCYIFMAHNAKPER